MAGGGTTAAAAIALATTTDSLTGDTVLDARVAEAARAHASKQLERIRNKRATAAAAGEVATATAARGGRHQPQSATATDADAPSAYSTQMQAFAGGIAKLEEGAAPGLQQPDAGGRSFARAGR